MHVSNLLPRIALVASGQLPCLQVYGSTYKTRDGTGSRDYVHVQDLALGHVSALTHLSECFSEAYIPPRVYNLGSGQEWTVLEVVAAMERASGCRIPIQVLFCISILEALSNEYNADARGKRRRRGHGLCRHSKGTRATPLAATLRKNVATSLMYT
jgi:nucleoside-diphosphate-sugar epimerase